MGMFKMSNRKTPKGSDATEPSSSPATVPELDTGKVSVIQARMRGNLSRQHTNYMKAHREHAPGETNGLMEMLSKCLPCLKS